MKKNIWLLIIVAVLAIFALVILNYYRESDQSVIFVTNNTVSTTKSPSNNTIKFSKETMSESNAINAVRNLADVRLWLKKFSNVDGTSPRTGGHPAFRTVRDGNLIDVIVYEDMPDHTATFNIYFVDTRNGKISSNAIVE